MGHRWGFVTSKMAAVLTASIQECDVYYLCGPGEFGEMIACDSPGCPLTWFHMECAGIHIEKNHRRSSKRGRKHRRQTGRVELNSTFPVGDKDWDNLQCRRHVCVKRSHMPESIAGGNSDLAAGMFAPYVNWALIRVSPAWHRG